MKVVGIDPGVHTGYAEWDADARRLVAVQELKIHAAMWSVLALQRAGELSHVVFEDARLRGNARAGAAVLMGAGSVRRDSSIWEDFLTDAGIAFQGLSPKQKGAKYDAVQFARITGWKHKTNEHGRDAGMLCFATKSLGSGN